MNNNPVTIFTFLAAARSDMERIRGGYMPEQLRALGEAFNRDMQRLGVNVRKF